MCQGWPRSEFKCRDAYNESARLTIIYVSSYSSLTNSITNYQNTKLLTSLQLLSIILNTKSNPLVTLYFLDIFNKKILCGFLQNTKSNSVHKFSIITMWTTTIYYARYLFIYFIPIISPAQNIFKITLQVVYIQQIILEANLIFTSQLNYCIQKTSYINYNTEDFINVKMIFVCQINTYHS